MRIKKGVKNVGTNDGINKSEKPVLSILISNPDKTRKNDMD